jgi:hypothetical protein
MGLLECQPMTSSRDVAHDGVLCTFSIRSSPDQGKWCGLSGQVEWTVHHVQKSHLAGVTLLQPARRVAVLGQLFSLKPHLWGSLISH